MTYLGPPVLSLPPSTATDQNGAANSVVEGAAANTLVGITAAATSQFGFPITYSLTADSSGGGFKIDPTPAWCRSPIPPRSISRPRRVTPTPSPSLRATAR